MNLQQNRDRLAEWMGWGKKTHIPSDSNNWKELYVDEYDFIVCAVNDWFPDQDLNQTRMIEKKLTKEQRIIYCRTQKFENEEIVSDDAHEWEYDWLFVHASAEQKFNALIQTLFPEENKK